MARTYKLFFDNLTLGGQWVRTRSGWRLSESEDSEPSKEEVQDLLGKHIKRESNRLMLEKASGISGAPRKFSVLYFNLSAGSGPFGDQ